MASARVGAARRDAPDRTGAHRGLAPRLRALSTQAKHLRRLVGHVPSADLLVRYSGLSQLKSNFGDKLLGQVSGHTGRLHGNFLIAKAKSGRFSSSKPNLQNIPKSDAMRSVFVAGPGKALVVADYSQLELRVMAEIANDEVMKGAYRKGLDLHAVPARACWGSLSRSSTPQTRSTSRPVKRPRP